MTTKQNNTAALTDEQLEGVAGGFIVGPISNGGRMRVGFRSVEPLPSPFPRMGVRYVSIDPVPFP
jgi:hypothetical protein